MVKCIVMRRIGSKCNFDFIESNPSQQQQQIGGQSKEPLTQSNSEANLDFLGNFAAAVAQLGNVDTKPETQDDSSQIMIDDYYGQDVESGGIAEDQQNYNERPNQNVQSTPAVSDKFPITSEESTSNDIDADALNSEKPLYSFTNPIQWESPINYRFDLSVDFSSRKLVNYAIRYLERRTCLEFREIDDYRHGNMIYIISLLQGNFGMIGRSRSFNIRNFSHEG